jgi:alkaline phosphatase D
MERIIVAILSTLALAPSSHADFQPPPAQDKLITRVAFGSCAFQSVEQPIFRTLVASEPDLYLSLGDAIYGDYDLKTKTVYEVTPETLRREWQVLADNPDWQYLRANVPVMATWDNHDYGHHSAGAEFPLKAESEGIFLDFFGEPTDSERRKRPGVYDAKVFGPDGRRLQIILLDTRSFKSLPVLAERPEGAQGSLGKYAPNTDRRATLLGAAQWEWLQQQLRQPAELRLIASSGQIIADQKGMDEWGNYPLERQRLLDMIDSQSDIPTVLLSGNAHFSEVSAIELDQVLLIDFTSSGLTHVNKLYPTIANPYRLAGPYIDSSFGLIQIDWDSGAEHVITLSAIGLDGGTAFTHSFSMQPHNE